MAAQLLQSRTRAYGLGAAIAVHVIAIALIVLFAPHYAKRPASGPSLIAMPPTAPTAPTPPSPPPDESKQGAAAPPSRGRTEARSPPAPPVPLARPTPAEPSIEVGPAQGSGAGAAAGSGAGRGGEGSGGGIGWVAPPVRIAGNLTNADYRDARPPQGAAGTVVVGFTVRANGRADTCHVIRSSGYAAFDEATCRLIERRFRYRPAEDASGRPVDWEVRTDYTWAPR